MAILLLAEHDGKALNPATARALAAALQISPQVDVLVAGDDCAKAAADAARLEGVRKVLLAEGESLAHQLAEPMAELAASLLAGGQYAGLLAAATSTGRDILPRVAAMRGVMQVSDIIEVVDETTFKRPIYAGNAIQTVRVKQAPLVATVRATAFTAVAAGATQAPVEEIAAPEPCILSAFVGEELTQSERPELTSARIVVSGGRGMGSKEDFAMLEGLAQKLGAAIGASRAAVDAGFAPNDWQVGQTGKIVAPELYIAIGISGAIQHLAGMKDSKVIVAINKDEEAPIFQVADYGLVADLFEAVPELEKALDKAAGDG